MIDRFTDKLYWPTIIAAWFGLFVAGAATLFGLPFSNFVRPALIGIVTFATFSFFVMLCDGATRRSVTAMNFYLRDHRAEINAARKAMSWRQRLIGPVPFLPDARLRLVFTTGPILMMAVSFAGQRDTAFLAFGSMFLAGIMIMLRIKRTGWGEQENVR